MCVYILKSLQFNNFFSRVLGFCFNMMGVQKNSENKVNAVNRQCNSFIFKQQEH